MMRKVAPVLMALLAWTIAAPTGFAQSEPDPDAMITQWIYAYYNSDAEKFWDVASRFKNQQHKNIQEVKDMMDARRGPVQQAISVKGEYLYGTTTLIGDEVGKIDHRVDKIPNSTSEMHVFTAFVTRSLDIVGDFGKREVEQNMVLKMYITIDGGKLISYHADEIKMEVTPPSKTALKGVHKVKDVQE